jgi:hypothetical protein
MLHCKDGARFHPDVTLGIQAKEFNLGFLRPKDLVSHGLSLPFGKLQAHFMCLLLRRSFRLATPQ